MKVIMFTEKELDRLVKELLDELKIRGLQEKTFEHNPQNVNSPFHIYNYHIRDFLDKLKKSEL
jgi:hypothetical protein